MNDNAAIVVLKVPQKGICVDLEIPLDISANELVVALNAAYELGIDISNIKDCYLKSENPIALLKGNKSLSAFGLRNGSIIHYTE